jgi:hypothetical protein
MAQVEVDPTEVWLDFNMEDVSDSDMEDVFNSEVGDALD